MIAGGTLSSLRALREARAEGAGLVTPDNACCVRSCPHQRHGNASRADEVAPAGNRVRAAPDPELHDLHQHTNDPEGVGLTNPTPSEALN